MKKISKRELVNAAGIVPVRIVDGQPLFLMLRAWTFWDFPKGRPEERETKLETALRETQEEASIPSDALEFVWGKKGYTTEPFKKGTKVTTYFVARTEQEEITLPVSPELGKPEHNEYRWVTYEEGKELTNERIGKVLDWAYELIQGG